MKKSQIFKPILKIALFLGIYFILQLLMGVILGVIYGIKQGIEAAMTGSQLGITNINEGLQQFTAQNMYYVLIAAIVLSIPAYLLMFKVGKYKFSDYCVFSKISWNQFFAVLLLGLPVQFFIGIVLSALSNIDALQGFFDSYNKLASQLTDGNFMLGIITVGIIVPVFEEILFRGFIFGEISKWLKLPATVIIQAVIFGLYHMNVIQGTYAVLIGVLLGIIYIRTKSLIGPILLHISINTSSVVMDKFMTDDTYNKYGTVFVILNIALLIGSIALLIVKNRNQMRSIAQEGEFCVTPKILLYQTT